MRILDRAKKPFARPSADGLAADRRTAAQQADARRRSAGTSTDPYGPYAGGMY